MDISTVITTVLTSGGVSGVVGWLMSRLIDHRLTKDLKDHQKILDQKLATTKAQVEAMLHKEVEEYLGDKAAERQYRLDAQKRLYTAIGPLKFQLVRACADFANRVDRIGTGKQPFPTPLTGYFGRSTVFRLLRLFAIVELIERQTAHADFSVDPSMAKLLGFKQEAFLCLSSSKICMDHPKANWNEQVEHVFYDRLSIIAAAMIVRDGEADRAMRFHEFNEFVSDEKSHDAIAPIPRLMIDFTVAAKPLLWVRFVALAQLCSAYVEIEGPSVGITPENFDGVKMLRASPDKFLVAQHDRYRQMLQEVAKKIVVSAS